MKYKSGEEFLNILYKNLHMDEVVMHTASKSDNPEEKIGKYMNRLEETHKKASDSKHKLDILKEFYYQRYVIKELPESYVELQKKIALEEGRGYIEVKENDRKEMLHHLQLNQKKSLDVWIDYLSSSDTMYPTWFKYYAFQGMLKLAKFDKENQKFKKRSIDTSGTFIELNPAVLNQIYTVIQNKIVGQNQDLTDEQVQALALGESFQKLYAYFLANDNISTDGVWIKYEQGNEYMSLWQSLYGKNTEWCIADMETAKNYMLRGDYMYIIQLMIIMNILIQELQYEWMEKIVLLKLEE